MKFFLPIVFSLATVLSAQSDNLEVENYLLESDFYNNYITEVTGVYVLYELPPRIEEDILEQTKLLKHYFFLRNNPKAFQSERVLPKAEVMKRILEIKNKNYVIEYRKYKSLGADIRKLENKLKKIDFYGDPEQVNTYMKDLSAEIRSIGNKYSNNANSSQLAAEFKASYYTPLKDYYAIYSDYDAYLASKNKGQDFRTMAIDRLSMNDYKKRWNFFKETKAAFLNDFFEGSQDDLKVLDEKNQFTVTVDLENWYGEPFYVLQVKMFKQDWYVLVDPDFQTARHEFSLIKM